MWLGHLVGRDSAGTGVVSLVDITGRVLGESFSTVGEGPAPWGMGSAILSDSLRGARYYICGPSSRLKVAQHLCEGTAPCAHPALLGGMARPCAALTAALAG